jgi:hypothetical protein
MAKSFTGRTACGFCDTGHHQNCRPKITWYDNVWYCECKTCRKQEKEDTPQNEETIQPIQEAILEEEEDEAELPITSGDQEAE